MPADPATRALLDAAFADDAVRAIAAAHRLREMLAEHIIAIASAAQAARYRTGRDAAAAVIAAAIESDAQRHARMQARVNDACLRGTHAGRLAAPVGEGGR